MKIYKCVVCKYVTDHKFNQCKKKDCQCSCVYQITANESGELPSFLADVSKKAPSAPKVYAAYCRVIHNSSRGTAYRRGYTPRYSRLAA